MAFHMAGKLQTALWSRHNPIIHLKARTLAIIAWIAALLTLMPIWPDLKSFFAG